MLLLNNGIMINARVLEHRANDQAQRRRIDMNIVTEKYCPKCKQVKSADEFGKHKKRHDGLAANCRICHNLIARELYKKDPSKHAARYKNWLSRNKDYKKGKSTRWARENRDRNKNSVLKRIFGITLDEYKDMFAKQNGVCLICGEAPKNRDLSVDHDHKTGKVRALLCNRCNSAVGYVRESIDIAKKLVEYLQEVCSKER